MTQARLDHVKPDPWGVQLAGPALEMGWLGAYERRTDTNAGGSTLVQMGVRAYEPGVGRFLSEDPVIGHVGVGQSLNRGGYVRNNAPNLFDTGGRDVFCPIWSCDYSDPSTTIRDPIHDLGEAGNALGGALDDVGAFLCSGASTLPCEPPIETAINGLQDHIRYLPCHEIGIGLDAVGVTLNSASLATNAIPGAQGVGAVLLYVGNCFDFAGVGLAALHEGGVC